MATKKCVHCKEVKDTSEFYANSKSKDKLASWCNTCTCKRARDWQKENREEWNQYKREQYADNPQYKRAHHGRSIIRKIIVNQGSHYKFLVECGAGSREAFMAHLSSTIPEGYTLSDYGSRDFDDKLCIDHILPCSSFDLTDYDEYKKCFNYKNLRLVTKMTNAKKNKKVLDL
jgi:hypothetical protein